MQRVTRTILTLTLLAAVWVPLQAADLQMARALSNTFAEIAEKVSPSVVTITSERSFKHPGLGGDRNEMFWPYWFFGPEEREFKSTSLGSGIIISDDGYIVTNNHVVEQGEDIKVKLLDGRELDAEIIGADPGTDVALLKIEAGNLKALKTGNSDQLRVGEWVLAIGSPFSGNLSHTVTQGIVSAKGRSTVGLIDYEDFIQTDAAINPGNSGGPLVNLDGDLVGVNSAIASRSGGYQGIGFAIPVNMVMRVVDDLRENGRVTRAYLGVYVQPVDADLARTFGLDRAYGALIGDVVDDSPADKAGLKAGDVILEFDGKRVENSQSLPTMVSTQRPGDKKKLRILREGDEMTVKVVLDELAEEMAAVDTRRDQSSDLGLDVETLTADMARRYDLPRDASGVVITKVSPGSEAMRKNLRSGNVIVKMGPDVKNLEVVESARDFRRTLGKFDAGETVLFLVKRGEDTFFAALTIPD